MDDANGAGPLTGTAGWIYDGPTQTRPVPRLAAIETYEFTRTRRSGPADLHLRQGHYCRGDTRRRHAHIF